MTGAQPVAPPDREAALLEIIADGIERTSPGITRAEALELAAQSIAKVRRRWAAGES